MFVSRSVNLCLCCSPFNIVGFCLFVPFVDDFTVGNGPSHRVHVLSLLLRVKTLCWEALSPRDTAVPPESSADEPKASLKRYFKNRNIPKTRLCVHQLLKMLGLQTH